MQTVTQAIQWQYEIKWWQNRELNIIEGSGTISAFASQDNWSQGQKRIQELPNMKQEY
jgi:hypothetical protein